MTILDYSRSLNAAQEGTLNPALRTIEMLQGLRFNEQDQKRQIQKDQANQDAEKKQQLARQEGARLLTEGSPEEISDFGIKNPTIMKDFIQAANFKDQTAIGSRVKYAQSVLGGNANPRKALEDRIQEVESGGGDATGLRTTLDIGTEEAIMSAAEKDLAVISPKMYESWRKATGKKTGSSGKVGTVSPKDFTVESIQDYQKSGNIKDLNRYSPKTIKIAGVQHSLNPINQRWEPVVDATSLKLTDQAKAISILNADKKSREDFGKSKVKWRTGRPKFRSKISSSKSSQNILDATAKQLKNNINAWSTKYGSSLSSLPGTEAKRLKNQLNTLKAHSAFSTLTDLKDSGGTLGAISEAELVLLKAKLGALDQSGDSAELIRVIDQIVNSNINSIERLETEFYNTNAMYSAGFDEVKNQSDTSLSLSDYNQLSNGEEYTVDGVKYVKGQ